ncbi:MAG: lysylphosphatidylglycerol synthase domain-containing protein, partial [Alphaproteobacteria bacterium]
MIRLAAFFGLLGLLAATGLIVWSGIDQIFDALLKAGWGILWTSLYHILSLIFCVIGWRLIIPGKQKPSHSFLLYILWLRSAVNGLMPVARIGGEVVAVRVMMKHGIKKTVAIASTVVELTLSVLAVFIFDVVGIGLFMWHFADRNMGWQ